MFLYPRKILGEKDEEDLLECTVVYFRQKAEIRILTLIFDPSMMPSPDLLRQTEGGGIQKKDTAECHPSLLLPLPSVLK